jgi:hypothetical protein
MRFVRRSSVIVLALSLTTSDLIAQAGSAADAQSRTRAIAASFSKFKSVSKSRHGITKEKYMKVTSEPAVKSNPADYTGLYEVPDMAFALDLTVDRSGLVTGSGYESLTGSVKRTFSLRDGRIDGALLTATKVYAGGQTEKLEGAFMNRTVSESPNDAGHTLFGFGTMGRAIDISGLTIEKFFFEKTR